MNYRLLCAAASCALLIGAAPSLAASILIDNFDDFDRVADEPLGSIPNNSQIAGGMVGGFRDLLVENDNMVTSGTELVAQLRPVTGDTILEFNNGTEDTGRGWVTYDGSNMVGTDPTNVNTMGLTDGAGGIDLLLGSLDLTGFLFDIFAVDQAGLFIEIRAWEYGAGSDLASAATYSETLPAGGGNPFVPFAAFGGAAIDWSNVGALQFFAESGLGPDGTRVKGLDGAIDSISVSVIPLPASALLLLGGVGGLGALRLRRRKG